MPSGTPILPPLRGYVPYGELDAIQDRTFRSDLALEVPMWEGSDRAYLRSIRYPGDGGQWIRPTHLAAGPSWVWNRNAGTAGFPKSGHNSIQVWARNGKVAGGQGYRYADIWDQDWSNFVVAQSWSVLVVGVPMSFMNPDLSTPSNDFRPIWTFVSDTGAIRHILELIYGNNTLRSRFNSQSSFSTPVPPFYGRRCSFLYTQGAEQGVIGQPRIYVGYEDGQIVRGDFTAMSSGGMQDAKHLNLFEWQGAIFEGGTAGGCWEYFAYYARSFDDAEARILSRDAMASPKWDDYVVRRTGFRRQVSQLGATPGAFGRISAAPGSRPRLVAVPSSYQRISATARHTGPRVSASPTLFQRVSARIRVADEEVNMQATALCPSEMNWQADNVLELADVIDELQDPPLPIVAATLVQCQIFDRSTGLEITVSPITLTQVGATNTWRESVLTNATNGFSQNQRLTLVFLFDGGAGLQGRFVALAVVASATS